MLPAMLRANPDGWAAVAVAFFVTIFFGLMRSALGVLIPFWEADLAWSRSFLSAGASLILVIMALASPIAGNLIDRVGPRTVFFGGLAATGGAAIIASLMTEPWHYLAVFCVLGGVGAGALSSPQTSTTIARYFVAHRGLAIGIASSGATGGLVFALPLLAYYATTAGWRPTLLVTGLIALALIPLAWFFIGRNWPEAPDKPARGGDAPLTQRLRLIIGARTFWLLLGGFAICGFTTAGAVHTHLVGYAVQCGFSPMTGASAYAVLSVFNMMGVIGCGYLADRVHGPSLLASLYLIRVISFIVILQITGSEFLLYLFAALFGLTDIATLPATASIVARVMGLRIMGLTLGMLFAGHSVGAAIGAFAAGWVFDLDGRYDSVWLASIALALLAALLTIMVRDGPARPASPVAAVPATRVSENFTTDH